MDVQKTNFAEAFEIFKSSLSTCEAVALDLEFTGIRGKPETFIDTCEDRYFSLRRIASTFRIIQVGLCLFSKHEGNWVARPFNFYVFQTEVPGFNQRLIMEVGAINFLKEHHMDFNTWFYNGVPYLNEAQSKDLESKLIDSMDVDSEDIVLTKSYEQVKMNEVAYRIERWLESGEDRIEITGLNAYLRKYLYGFVKRRFKGVFMNSLKIEGSRDVTLVLQKADAKEHAELEAKRFSDKTDQFHEKIGFRRIFTLLTDSKIPLIVHNGMLDILFTISAFQEDLPEKYQDFKSLVHRLFPTIYDTRFMLERIPGFYDEFDKITSAKGLKELYNFVKSGGPEVSLASDFSKYLDESFAHEAGFDAYMTGICFLKLCNSNLLLSQYRNLLPLYKSFFAVNLDGEDPMFNDGSFYVKGPEAKHCLSGVEGLHVKYVKDDECFVRPLVSEKQAEIDKIVLANNLTCMPAETYFMKKRQVDKNKHSHDSEFVNRVLTRQSSDIKNEILESSPKGRFYRFNDELGSGAFKVVYRGFDNEQGCEVAWNTISLKNLTAKDKAQINEELKLNRKLNHPNIVHFIFAWTNTVKEELVFITEIVTGGNLKQYLKRIKKPRLRVIKTWCKQILQGLHYLHSQKPYPIIHRDIKTANIFVMNNTGDIKIGDFGLSTLMQGAMQTSVLGTPEYMAPEVYKGKYDTKIDIYAFGMVVIEICTGKSPYSECSNQAGIYKKVMSGEAPASLKLIENPEVQDFVKKCIRPYTERPTAEELIRDKFLVIKEEDDAVHHPMDVVYSPRSDKSSISSSLSCIDISLIITKNGEQEQVTFPFNLESDTPEHVAEEMVQDLELGPEFLVLVAKEIENKIPTEYLSASMNEEKKANREFSFGKDELDCLQLTKKKSMKLIRSENDLQTLGFENLKKGYKNKESVHLLQNILSIKLGKNLTVDGVFGADTEFLVKMYQQAHGFKPDGVVNIELWNHLLGK